MLSLDLFYLWFVTELQINFKEGAKLLLLLPVDFKHNIRGSWIKWSIELGGLVSFESVVIELEFHFIEMD